MTAEYQPKTVRKSQFIGKEATDLTDSDSFDFVKNNQNFKVPLSELVKKFGVTGSLETLGEVTGIPVLVIDGTTNKIRNVVGNSGILASISPQDGLQLDHNFEADKTGLPVLADETTEKPKIRSLIQGSGISLAVVNGSIQIAASATPVTTKTVIVNEEADFPSPSAGVITLEADTFYFLTSDIVTVNRFVLQEDTVVGGSDGTLITLEYTGSGNMFTTVNCSNKLRDLIVKCDSGTVFDMTCGLGTGIFQSTNCRFSCATIGSFDGFFVVSFQNTYWQAITTDGFTFLNNNSIISFFQNIGSVSNGTFIDLGSSTFDGFSFTNSLGVLSAGTTFISGLVNSGNVNAGGLASVLNTRALGAGTALSGITSKDALWEFLANSGIPNSRNTMLAINTGTTVTISATNTPVIIGAAWVEQEVSRFTTTTGGRFTYTGNGAFIVLQATISADLATGVDDCTFYFAKNGSVITDSGVLREIDAGDPGNLTLFWELELITNDYIEVFCENNDATANIIIVSAIVRFD